MRSLVLGAFIVASFGLSAAAAEPPSDAKTAGAHARRACQVVTADRTLRLLRDSLPGERRIAVDRPASRPISTPAKEPVMKASRAVMPVRAVSRPAPFHAASRLEPVRFLSRSEPARLLSQHLSLMVGVSF
jgi:hypothetical protein